MLLGILPSDQLLAQYQLTEYADVATAMRLGDVGLLMRCLDANQLAFVQACVVADFVSALVALDHFPLVASRKSNNTPPALHISQGHRFLCTSLLQAGTYLLLEKLQLATYRRLIKK